MGYYRHIYARVQGGPTVHQRFDSYYNYCKLFNYILSADTPVNLELPNQWLWEIIDKMQRGELAEFESCFAFSCPKFLSPVPPNYDAVNFDSDNHHKEPLKLQLKVFMEEVQQQLMLPTIRSYLKLYTTMPLDKMAGFMEMPAEEFRNHLLAFKHKMKNVVWTKGTSGLEGEFQSGSEVDFYIDKNMIHIADTKVARRYGDFFIRQIHKFDELNRGLRKIQL